MAFFDRRWRSVMLAVILALFQASHVHAIVATYCSPENTGGSIADTYRLNSEGHCRDICSFPYKYAYSITQGENCWCSDQTPSRTVSLFSCSESCPGFPEELCGSSDDGLYNYLALGPKPSPARDPRPPPTSVPPETVVHRSTVFKTHTHTVSAKDPKGTPKVVTSVKTRVITRTDTKPGATAPPESSPSPTAAASSGLSGGAIAGVAIGVLLAIAIVAAVIFCCCCSRSRREGDNERGGGLIRNSSVLSKVGLLRHSSSTREPPPYSPQGSSNNRQSRPPRLDTSIPVVSGGPSSAGTNQTMTASRDSRPLFVDQRLNPNAWGTNSYHQQNESRTSIGTLEDDKDYSRPLEVRNPDPEPSPFAR